MTTVWLVCGYDVGGNSGDTIEAVFSKEADARQWAAESPRREDNNAFSSMHPPFYVAECVVFQSIAEAVEDIEAEGTPSPDNAVVYLPAEASHA